VIFLDKKIKLIFNNCFIKEVEYFQFSLGKLEFDLNPDIEGDPKYLLKPTILKIPETVREKARCPIILCSAIGRKNCLCW